MDKKRQLIEQEKTLYDQKVELFNSIKEAIKNKTDRELLEELYLDKQHQEIFGWS